MAARRSFFEFLFLRYLAWGLVAILIAWGLALMGIRPTSLVPLIAGLALAGAIPSFLEFDSLPRKLGISDGEVVIIDASGEEVTFREFAIVRWLWLTRIKVIREGKVLILPLEAYRSIPG